MHATERRFFMKTNKVNVKLFGALLVTCAILLLGSSAVSANMCQIIRLYAAQTGGSARVDIFPQRVTVPVGTCTVWINFINDTKVQVSFRENVKQCILSTEASAGFKEITLASGESCYISETLPRGKTASLVWKKPGVFKYTLELVGSKGMAEPSAGNTGRVPVEGVIEVR